MEVVGGGGRDAFRDTPSLRQGPGRSLPKPIRPSFFSPRQSCQISGAECVCVCGGVPVTHKANRNEKHCRWKRTRGGDGDAGSMGGGRGVNHLASCAASILQLPPTTTHLPLGKNRERERERKGKRDREKKKNPHPGKWLRATKKMTF